MPATPAPRSGDVVVSVGTKKGLFLFWSDEGRREWQRSHHHPNWQVFASAYDARDGSLYASTNSPFWGGLVARTGDFGGTWDAPGEGLDFPAESEFRVTRVWQIEPGPAAGEVYAGTERAGLFRSADKGAHWELVSGLANHPHAPTWSPGNGGLCLHTILRHPAKPDRMTVAISTGGCYRSEDGGASWNPRNVGLSAIFLPGDAPEYGQCVHKVAGHAADPDLMYLQNHGGVYRSDDGGDHWLDIASGLPSDFGFPIVAHPHDPDTAYVVPLDGERGRLSSQERMSVWRTRDRGASWTALTAGLPDDAFFVVLRDAMAADACAQAGLYVGTTTGQIFLSTDDGDNWSQFADNLPPVLSITTGRAA